MGEVRLTATGWDAPSEPRVGIIPDHPRLPRSLHFSDNAFTE